MTIGTLGDARVRAYFHSIADLLANSERVCPHGILSIRFNIWEAAINAAKLLDRMIRDGIQFEESERFLVFKKKTGTSPKDFRHANYREPSSKSVFFTSQVPRVPHVNIHVTR